MWGATSGTDDAAAYATDGRDCECRAGLENDPVCKHRAMFWNRMGVLDLDPEPEPTPALVVVPAPPAGCGDCDGRGWIRKQSHIFPATYRITCRSCRGSGRPAAPLAA